MNKVKGFKGFDKNMQCLGFQYAAGKKYEHPGEVKCCPNSDDIVAGRGGFHFCTDPRDVFGYYPPADSRFAEVEGSGSMAANDGDSKVACKSLHVESEITLTALLRASVKFTLDRVDWKNKKESNTGDQSAATVEGKDSIACGLGYKNKVRGASGCWLVLAERSTDGALNSVKTVVVDGEKIKENVFYELQDGEFCIAE